MMITIEPEDTDHYRHALAAGKATPAAMPVARALQRATGLLWEANPSRAWYKGKTKDRVEFVLPQPLYRLQRRAMENLPATTALTFDLLWPPATEDAPAEDAQLPADYFLESGR